MDVAHMILDIAKEEASKKRATIKVSFGYDSVNGEKNVAKEYDIAVMAHPKDKGCYQVEYRNASFKHPRGRGGRSPMELLFKQVCRRYMWDSETFVIDHDDYVRMKVFYMGEEIANDAHTVLGHIDLDDLSISANVSEENYDLDDLMAFFMSYYSFVERLEL